MKFRHCSLEISQQKNYFAHFGNKLFTKGRCRCPKRTPRLLRGVGGNKALHPFQIWKASSAKSGFFNCTINWTVEQVIIRAYLLIFERVLSLHSHFVVIFSAFKEIFLDFGSTSIMFFLEVPSKFVCISRHLNR